MKTIKNLIIISVLLTCTINLNAQDRIKNTNMLSELVIINPNSINDAGLHLIKATDQLNNGLILYGLATATAVLSISFEDLGENYVYLSAAFAIIGTICNISAIQEFKKAGKKLLITSNGIVYKIN